MKKLRFIVLLTLLACGPEEITPNPEKSTFHAGFIFDEFKDESFIVVAREKSAFFNALSTKTVGDEWIDFPHEAGEYATRLEDSEGGRWSDTGLCL